MVRSGGYHEGKRSREGPTVYGNTEHVFTDVPTDVTTLVERTRHTVATLRTQLTALLSEPEVLAAQDRRDSYRAMAGEVERLHGFLLADTDGGNGRAPGIDCLLAEKAGGEPRLDLLVVEDNPVFVRFLREALRERSLAGRTWLARDGEEALEFLHQQGSFVHAPRPALVLLDWHLPRKEGRDVLREMKEDAALGSIPVVVLSTSSCLVDIRAAYNLRAAGYLVKPDDLGEMVHVIRSLESTWKDGGSGQGAA